MGEFSISAFSSYIEAKWHGDFVHKYKITRHHSWNRWRSVCKNPDEIFWYCSSLEQAAAHYSWTGSDAETEYKLLSSNLQAALESGDEGATYDVCRDIFRWGGVARKPDDKSIVWLDRKLKEQALKKSLLDACALLKNINSDLVRFDGCDLIMNSAMTKVYAACDPAKLIIYDGRVGAALGLLAKDYLRSINHRGAVPALLAFCWGASQEKYVSGRQNKRDPSDNEFYFPNLFASRRDRMHAEMMRNTSALLIMVDKLLSDELTSKVPHLEQALFMVGYDVSRSALT